MEKMLPELQKEHYGVDPKLIIGIAKAESSMGKAFAYQSDRQNYNFWGIKPKGGRRADGSYLAWYGTPEEAVRECARILHECYISRGLNTPEEIVNKYVGRRSQNWVNTVNSVF